MSYSFEMTPDEIRNHIQYKVSCRELREDIAQRMLDLVDKDGSVLNYEVLHREAVRFEIPEKAFHASSPSNRESILENGLLPSDPTENREWLPRGFNPVGVYLSSEPDQIGSWVHETTWDIWEVDTSDLAWKHDDLNEGSYIISEKIEPSRLRLLISDFLPTWSRDLS